MGCSRYFLVSENGIYTFQIDEISWGRWRESNGSGTAIQLFSDKPPVGSVAQEKKISACESIMISEDLEQHHL